MICDEFGSVQRKLNFDVDVSTVIDVELAVFLAVGAEGMYMAYVSSTS